MLEECVGQLDEPFRRSEVIGWFRRHYPEVNEATLGAHIQAATANALNRAQNNPLGTRAPLLRRIDHGLYVRAGQEAQAVPVLTAAAALDSARGSRPGRRDQARPNVEALVGDFDRHVRRFEASGVFSGPSVYFHERAIERWRLHATAGSLIADQLFLEYVYAVLPSWGMHRMGTQAAKVTEFGQLAASLRAAAPVIEELWPLDITRLTPASAPAVGQRAWQVIAAIRASTSETQIVAGSKTLHHLLPSLIPPIDRQYTSRFFTGQKAIPSEEDAFLEWFRYFAEIGQRCSTHIDAVITRGGLMATGPSKVIDNAIVGFMQAKDSQVQPRPQSGS
jgi:hypothetical protein